MYNYAYFVNSANADGGNVIEVSETRFRLLFATLVRQVRVDERWYRKTYADVSSAISNGEFASAQAHYEQAGFYEDRFPFHIEVDEVWYLKQNSDVAAAIRSGAFLSAQEHFSASGFREGRLPSANWSLGKTPSSTK